MVVVDGLTLRTVTEGGQKQRHCSLFKDYDDAFHDLKLEFRAEDRLCSALTHRPLTANEVSPYSQQVPQHHQPGLFCALV